MKNIVLMGFKGSGKTTTGRALAKIMGMDFVDNDAVLEDLHKKEKNESLSFREIRKKYGAEYFAELEAKAVQLVSGEKNCIIGLGGGTIKNPANMELLKKNGFFVYLKTAPEILLERIRRGGVPAFLDPDDLEGSMRKELSLREPIYMKNADLVIDCKRLFAAAVAQLIASKLPPVVSE